jgi:hypothetical protein
MLSGYLTLGDRKIEIRYVEGDYGFAAEAFAALSEALPSLADYFALSEPFPKVRVVLAPDRGEFDHLVRDLLRLDLEVPSAPSRIGQSQRTDMVVLSPSAYETHSVFKYIRDDFRRLLVHELIHIVEEHLSPDMEATPRWWSEGLAVYLSAQWHDEDDFREPVLEGIERDKIPQISEIQRERNLAYQWGWTIVRFLEITYGKELVLRIVKECADGDVLSMTEEEIGVLEKRWVDWLIHGGSGIG